MNTMCLVDFYQWINEKYIEWANGRKSETQFAQWLGISQATFNAWQRKARGVPKSQVLIEKIASKLGPEIYDILGIERPDFNSVSLDSLPSDIRTELESTLREMKERSERQYIADPNSPEARALAIELFGKFFENQVSKKISKR